MKTLWIGVLVAATSTAVAGGDGPPHVGPVTMPAKRINPGSVAYDIAPGTFQDFSIGLAPAGTTFEFGNCDTPQQSSGLTISVLEHANVLLTNNAQCTVNFGPGHAYATFSSRLGTEQFTVRITCPAGTSHCKGDSTLAAHHDFNGDLMNVREAFANILIHSKDASIILIDDPKPIFTDPDHGVYAGYGCTAHDDHPEGVVRLANNRFAITTDFGNSGKLFLAVIGSKKVDDQNRLATNIASGDTVSSAVAATDKLITVNDAIGKGRGHLSGAARSGDYLIVPAEADDQYVNGMISIVDTRNDALRVVDHYSNELVLNNKDGAGWATSAKLPSGSSDPKADNYIPPELQNAHVFVSAGTAMKTTNVVYRPRDGGGYSALTPNDRAANDFRSPEKPSTEFLPWAIGLPEIPTGDNQASLLTQSNGEVYLMTLNGNASNGLQNSTLGYAKLYRVHFNKCAQKVCFELIVDKSFTDDAGRRNFETKSYVDFARAAGSYTVATGNHTTDKIMVYGLWATKVKGRTGTGCGTVPGPTPNSPAQPAGGPYLRMMEF